MALGTPDNLTPLSRRTSLTRRLPVFLAIAVAAFAGLLLYGYRLTLGTNLGDEGYYANLVIGRLRTPVGDTGDNAPQQLSGAVMEPLIRLYSHFSPRFIGVILYLRLVYAVLALLTSAAVWTLLRRLRTGWTAAAVALVPIVFIPWGLPALSYNTLGMLGTIAGLSLCGGRLLRLWSGERSGWADFLAIPLAGVLLAVVVVAYPPMAVTMAAFVLFALLLAPTWRDARPLLILLAFGAPSFLLVLGAAIATLGYHKIQSILAFEQAAGEHLRCQTTLRLACDQFTLHRAYPIYCALGFLAAIFGRFSSQRGSKAVAALALLALAAAVVLLPLPPGLFTKSHDLIFFLTIVGLPILLDLFRLRTLTPGRRILLLLYGTGCVSGLLTTWSSSNSLINFPVGGLLAVLAVLTAATPDADAPSGVGTWTRLAFSLACVAALAICSFFTIYGFGVIRPKWLDTAVVGGPYAGLRTTRDQAVALDQLHKQLAAFEDRCRTLLVLGPYPGLYLLTSLKPQTPHSWFDPNCHTRADLWGRVRDCGDQLGNLPDLIVSYWEQVPHSVEPLRDFLNTYYRPLAPNHAELYLRRDLPAPAVACPFTFRFDQAPPGAGWSVPQMGTDGQPFVWMAAREATLHLPLPTCPGSLRLRLEARYGMAEDVFDSLTVRVNGRKVELSAAALPGGGRVYETPIARDILSAVQDRLELRLSVNRTIVPLVGDDRTLAIAFRSLVLTDGKSP